MRKLPLARVLGWKPKRERVLSSSPEKKSSSRVQTRAREEGSHGGVFVDEGGEEVSAIFDIGVEGEDEEGKEDECEKMRPEDRPRLSQNLRRRVRVQAWRRRLVVVHGGFCRVCLPREIKEDFDDGTALSDSALMVGTSLC
ncbi:hypothetical protein LOK49_LG06G01053 [Camellia lanceoleosa]|uniref:Uncharacterized protein n=1 Tax=Camellia lanceoleosa TaxID=1840588 RepID=A0ACC0HD41_9ERIC|nr:hypothetical protein LOK49_LG06G01053 [Camellia lanceoleosa]